MSNSNAEFVLVTQGTRGDILPILSLARSLRRGYPLARITVLANSNWRPLCLEDGLEFMEICPEDPAQDVRQRSKFIKLNVYQAFNNSLEILSSLVAAGRRLIVFSILAMRGVDVAAELYSFRSIKICLQPFTLYSEDSPSFPNCTMQVPHLDRALCRNVSGLVTQTNLNTGPYFSMYNRFRVKQGLGKLASLHTSSHQHSELLCFFPEWFAKPPADWPQNVRCVGFPPPAKVDIDDTGARAFIKANPKPIIFSPGTGVADSTKQFEAVIQASKFLARPLLVVISKTDATSTILRHKDSTEIFFSKMVNLNEILSDASVFIHHGGIGSVANAVRAGTPQVVKPDRFDQPDNARRVENLGLGVMVEPKQFNVSMIVETLTNGLDRKISRQALDGVKSDTKLRDAYLFDLSIQNVIDENSK